MLSNNDAQFPFGTNYGLATDSVFYQTDKQNTNIAPVEGNFELLDGTPFLLLDGTNFLLL